MGNFSRFADSNAKGDVRQDGIGSVSSEQSWIDDVALGTHVDLALKSGSFVSGTLKARDKKSITVVSSAGGMKVTFDRRDILVPHSDNFRSNNEKKTEIEHFLQQEEKNQSLLSKAGMKAGIISFFIPKRSWGIVLGDDKVEYSFKRKNISDQELDNALATEFIPANIIRVVFVPSAIRKKDGTMRPIATGIIRESEFLAQAASEDEINEHVPIELFAEKTPIEDFNDSNNALGIGANLNDHNEPIMLTKKQENIAIREGQRAFREKDFKTAENQFLLLFDAGTPASINSVIGDYVSMCIQIEGKAKEAAEILDGHKRDIEPNKFRNLSIMVYEKSKDYEKLLPLYHEAFQLGTSGNQGKSHALLRMIDAFIALHRYAEGLAACRQWLSFCEQCKYNSSYHTIAKARTGVRRKEAVCLYQLKQIDEAKAIASELILDNPSDQIARMILEETLDADQEAITSAEDSNLAFFSFFSGTEEVSSEAIPDPFVLEQIQSVDIGSQIRRRVSNNMYTGTLEEASYTIDRLLNPQTAQSHKVKAEARFIVCSLISQMKARYTTCPETWTDSYIRALSGRAMVFWGHSKISIGQLDTSRMAYLYSIKTLDSTETAWQNAISCYLKSYSKGSLVDYVEQLDRDNTFDLNSIEEDLPDIILPTFTIGFLDLINALDDKPQQRESLLEGFFADKAALANRMTKQAEELFGSHGAINTADDFKVVIDRASTTIQTQNKRLEQQLSRIADTFMSSALSDELLESVEPSQWKKWLSNSDFERLRTLQAALIKSQVFFETADFDSRAEALRFSMQDLGSLRDVISNQPTVLSFDVLRPFIDACISSLMRERSELYTGNQPELTFEEAAPAVLTPEGEVFVQLRVSNAKGCQTAKHIVFDKENAISEEVLSVEGFEEIDLLQGGGTSDAVLTILVSDVVRMLGSFTIKLKIAFMTQDDSQASSRKAHEDEMTIVIANEDKEPLKNPYVGHVGNAITAADDKMFYGRETEIADIVGKLRDEGSGKMIAHGAVVLYGQTRAGKSSLMAQIKNTAARTYGDSVLICNFGSIADVRSVPGDPDSFMAHFLYTLLDGCCDAVESNGLLSEEFDYKDLTPPDEMLDKPAHAQAIFKTKMRKLSKLLEEKDVLLVLLIDEFTYIHGLINTGAVSEYFMRFWKSLLQNYYLFAIVVGQDDMPEFMREYENEFHSMEPRKVTYLDEASAKKLIREPLERENGKEGLFRDDAVDEVYRLTAGSAYLTMNFCARLVSYLNEKGAPIVTKGLVRDFLGKRALGPAGFLERGNFESMLNERGHDELKAENTVLLHEIAKLAKSTRQVPISSIRCDGIDQDKIRALIDRLVNRDVLIQTKDEVEIKVKLFERWLIETMGE